MRCLGTFGQVCRVCLAHTPGDYQSVERTGTGVVARWVGFAFLVLWVYNGVYRVSSVFPKVSCEFLVILLFVLLTASVVRLF